MFDKKAIDALMDIKKSKEVVYASIMCDGNIYEDSRSYIEEKGPENINECCSHIDNFLESSIRTLAVTGATFDKVEFGFLIGAIYNKADLENGQKIIKEVSKPLKDKVRYYTGNLRVYNNNELVEEVSFKKLNGYQGTVNYDRFIASLAKEGLSFKGPQTYEELISFIESGSKDTFYIVADFKEQKEVKPEPVQEIVSEPVQEIVLEPVQEENKKVKKRRLFKK